jgi:hypothetical protein
MMTAMTISALSSSFAFTCQCSVPAQHWHQALLFASASSLGRVLLCCSFNAQSGNHPVLQYTPMTITTALQQNWYKKSGLPDDGHN